MKVTYRCRACKGRVCSFVVEMQDVEIDDNVQQREGDPSPEQAGEVLMCPFTARSRNLGHIYDGAAEFKRVSR